MPALEAGCNHESDGSLRTSLDTVLSVSVRGSSWNGSEGVLQIGKASKTELDDLNIECNSLQNYQSAKFTLTLAPRQVKEIGWMEGWRILPQEHLFLYQIDHTAIEFDTYRAEDGSVGIRRSHEIENQALAAEDAEEMMSAFHWVAFLACVAFAGFLVFAGVKTYRAKRF